MLRRWAGLVKRKCVSLVSYPLLRHTTSSGIQTYFAGAVNVAAFLLTNSRTVSGACPVSVNTSSDVRSIASRAVQIGHRSRCGSTT